MLTGRGSSMAAIHFSMGWHPESGFLASRWNKYCELMMIYLLGIGSPTHPGAPDALEHFTRPVIHYKASTTSAATTRSSRISIRRRGTTFAASATPTPITLTIP